MAEYILPSLLGRTTFSVVGTWCSFDWSNCNTSERSGRFDGGGILSAVRSAKKKHQNLTQFTTNFNDKAKSIFKPMQVAYHDQTGEYPVFLSMKQLRLFDPPPPRMGGYSIAGLHPSIRFTSTHLCTWVERGTMRVKSLAQEHNAILCANAEYLTWSLPF